MLELGVLGEWRELVVLEELQARLLVLLSPRKLWNPLDVKVGASPSSSWRGDLKAVQGQPWWSILQWGGDAGLKGTDEMRSRSVHGADAK